MRQPSPTTMTNRTPGPPRRFRFRFRAFYITVLAISLFAVLSLVADQSARYRHGAQYGVAQRRALAELDVHRLVKRDEEVSQRPVFPGNTLLPFQMGLQTNNYRPCSVVWSTMRKINAPSSKRIVQMKKRASSRTYLYTIATSKMRSQSPSSYCRYGLHFYLQRSASLPRTSSA
jgi:sodium/potassium/calcium exchanger 6